MRILLVTDIPETGEAIAASAPAFEVTASAGPGDNFAHAIAAAAPDLILIRVEDSGTFPFAELTSTQEANPIPVVMLDNGSDPEMLANAAGAGVHGHFPVDAGLAALQHIAEWAKAQLNATAALKSKLREQETKLADRIVIERAKGVVMKIKGLPEDTAYHEIRKMAMRRSLPMRAVAEQIIDTADLVMNE